MDDTLKMGEALENFFDTLAVDPLAPAPAELDPESVTLVRAVAKIEGVPEPDEAVAKRVWNQTLAMVERTPTWREQPGGETGPRNNEIATRHLRVSTLVGNRRWQLWASVAIAAALILSVISVGFWWIGRPQPVNAQQVLEKAFTASANLSATSVHNYHIIREESTDIKIPSGNGVPDFVVTTTVERWVEIPSRYRTVSTTRDSKGELTILDAGSDSTTAWQYENRNGKESLDQHPASLNPSLQIEPPLKPPGMMPVTKDTLQQVLEQVNKCWNPKLLGEETVAGRLTYKLDVGPTMCSFKVGQSAPDPSEQWASHLLWIDKQTFITLKEEAISPDGRTTMRSEVSQVQYNITMSNDVFVYRPLSDTDQRPKTP
ncbi:MAG: hypothetical protein ACR2M3_07415 [Thermomicrobiales bacterium]